MIAEDEAAIGNAEYQAVIDIVLPVTRDHFERAQRLLLPTLRANFGPFGHLWIITPDSHQHEAVKRFGGPGVTVLGERGLIPEIGIHELASSPIDGWYIQQLIKLTMARLVSTKHYLCVDDDVICGRPVKSGELLREGRSMAHRCGDYHTEWDEWSERVLGMPRPVDSHGVTPALLARDVVLDLFAYLSTRFGGDAEQVLLQNLPWTEYRLYYTYLYAENRFDAFHFNVDWGMEGNSAWSAEEMAAWDPAKTFSPDAKPFCVLHSKSAAPVDEIVTRIREHFVRVGRQSPV